LPFLRLLILLNYKDKEKQMQDYTDINEGRACPHFGQCGGCALQKMSVENYRAEKWTVLKEIKDKLTDGIWLHGSIRRRAEFHFDNGVFGFFAARSKEIVRIENCPLLTLPLQSAVAVLNDIKWAGSGSVKITDLNGKIDIIVKSSIKFWTPELKGKIAKIDGINGFKWNDDILIPGAFLSDVFLQPSAQGENAIREIVKSELTGYKVADVFCGIGTFTFDLDAIGFDSDKDAIEIARSIKQGCAKVRDLFKNPLRESELSEFNGIVIDPPRAGATAQCKKLAVAKNIEKIVYVSCNPETFLKDMKILESGGFKLLRATPIDQFEFTNHLELVAVFAR
jgi:23S rRNA (uracil1939-C5)-methyltransferase